MRLPEALERSSGAVKSPTAFSRKAMELVFELCEIPRPAIMATILAHHFPEAADELEGTAAFPTWELVFVTVADDHGIGVPVTVEWVPEINSYGYFDSSAGWVPVDTAELCRYPLDLDWMLRTVRAALGYPPSSRPVALVPDLLWDLGKTWVGKRKASILFARRMAYPVAVGPIIKALDRRGSPGPTLLLTSSFKPLEHLRLPRRCRMLSVWECMAQESDRFGFDMEVLDGTLHGAQPVADGDGGGFEHSADYRVVRVGEQEFRFRGEKQRRIVEYLHQRWQDGQTRVSVAELIADLELPANTRLRDLFKGHDAWGTLLGYERGTVWLVI